MEELQCQFPEGWLRAPCCQRLHQGSAAAYSVAAPGCRVLALCPQATLDPRIAGFDNRYVEERMCDFTTRYGYAPDMIEGALQGYIVFDPLRRLDATHAALFTRKNVVQLRAAHLGHALEPMFAKMGIQDGLIRAAMEGNVTEAGFARVLRTRRQQKKYLYSVFQHAIQTEHHQLAANLCAYVLRHGPDIFFESRLKALKKLGFTPRSTKRIKKAL